jgi:hypothetical protein
MSAFLGKLASNVLGGRCLSVWSPRSPPPPLYTVWIHTPVLTVFTQGQGGGIGEPSEKVSGALVHKRGRKYQHGWLYFQSINSIKHQKRRHLGFGVFKDIWSMGESIRWERGEHKRQRRRSGHDRGPVRVMGLNCWEWPWCYRRLSSQ